MILPWQRPLLKHVGEGKKITHQIVVGSSRGKVVLVQILQTTMEERAIIQERVSMGKEKNFIASSSNQIEGINSAE